MRNGGTMNRRPNVGSELRLARESKRAGMTKAEFVDLSEKVATDAARLEGWSAAELAAVLADQREAADDAWRLGDRQRNVRAGSE